MAFDEDVRYDRAFGFLGKARVNHKVASFRQIDVNDPHVQHDALEFPNGQILKIKQLVAGQTATVLQLPVATHHHEHLDAEFVARVTSRVTLNRVSAKSGIASILMPNLGAVMLWQARHAAIKLSTGFVQSFRRQPAASMPRGSRQAWRPAAGGAVEDAFVQKPEKKIGVKAAA